MSSGIRATVTFDAPDGCPIATASADANGAIEDVSTSVSPRGTSESVTDFLVPTADGDGHVPERTPRDVEGAEAVFAYGSADLYRATHGNGEQCPCECLGEFGCPVYRYVADGGEITIVFHAADMTQLQSVMDELLARHPSVNVQRLLHPPLEGEPKERVFVNRGRLTDRQLEVLRAAYAGGYFERPKRANATELADRLGISQSTFTEHLMAAQRKLLGDVLEQPE